VGFQARHAAQGGGEETARLHSGAAFKGTADCFPKPLQDGFHISHIGREVRFVPNQEVAPLRGLNIPVTPHTLATA